MKTVVKTIHPRIKRSRTPRWTTLSAGAWAAVTYGSVALGDKRRNERAVQVAATLAARPADSIPRAAADLAEAKAIYRFVGGKKQHVTAAPLIRAAAQATVRHARGEGLVLAPQDTTGLAPLKQNTIKGLGLMASGRTTRGLFLHSTLALREDGVPIGVLDLQTWARTEEVPEKGSKAYRQRPIEEKESFKWIAGVRAAHEAFQTLPEDERPRIIHLGDREEDFYEAFAEVKSLGDSAVIRCTQNRCVLTEDGQATYAHQAVRDAPLLARRSLKVPRHENQPARKAVVELRAVCLRVPPPQGHPDKNAPVLELALVEVFEPNPPSTVAEPLHWRLWTLEPVDDLAAVLRVTEYYKLRWRVEDYHVVVKEGCRVENAQFETLERLDVIIALYASVALYLLRWRDLARAHPDWPCTVLLSDLEWRSLLIATARPGQKADLDRPPPTLREANLLLGRLGGHLNRKGDGPPGVKTLWLGYRDLMLLTDFHHRLSHS